MVVIVEVDVGEVGAVADATVPPKQCYSPRAPLLTEALTDVWLERSDVKRDSRGVLVL